MEGNVEHAPAELEGLVRVRRGAIHPKWIHSFLDHEFEDWWHRYKKVHKKNPPLKAILKYWRDKEDPFADENDTGKPNFQNRGPPARPPTRH